MQLDLDHVDEGSIRNPHPNTEPTAEATIPARRSALLTRADRPCGRVRWTACLRQRATRLEKRKEAKAKAKTWKETRSFSTCAPATQLGGESPSSPAPEEEGFQARPTKIARVKMAFTFTIPSSAVMSMLVSRNDCKIYNCLAIKLARFQK
ncbi:hypothetical protein BHE74_00059551 [Ensete ventricosum]|nr:hypothetical protein BHE74_00059551 [Ensete ventricosum]